MDISDIIQQAKAERAEYVRKVQRRREIEEQIATLQAELQGLLSRNCFSPQWRMDLDERIRAELEKEETT